MTSIADAVREEADRTLQKPWVDKATAIAESYLGKPVTKHLVAMIQQELDIELRRRHAEGKTYLRPIDVKLGNTDHSIVLHQAPLDLRGFPVGHLMVFNYMGGKEP